MGLADRIFERIKEAVRARVPDARLPDTLPRNARDLWQLLELGVQVLRDIAAPRPPAPSRAEPFWQTAPAPASATPPSQPEPQAVPERPLDAATPDLPAGYAEGRVVLLPRDAHSLHAYCDQMTPAEEEARRRSHGRVGLRLRDVTDRGAAPAHFDLPRGDPFKPLTLPALPEHTYVAELGFWDAEGRFSPLRWSAPATAPPAAPSPQVRDAFATVPWAPGPLDARAAREAVARATPAAKRGRRTAEAWSGVLPTSPSPKR
jgi:hypothetical protein